MKNDSDLFYTCSLIEFIGRQCKRKRSDIVNILTEKTLSRIYRYADVLHCEVIANTADTYIREFNIQNGTFDNVGQCRYTPPDYWDIGEVYSRLIEDVTKDAPIQTLLEVYNSWISDSISNYNSDFFYQPRDYIKECYLAGTVL